MHLFSGNTPLGFEFLKILIKEQKTKTQNQSRSKSVEVLKSMREKIGWLNRQGSLCTRTTGSSLQLGVILI